MKKLYALLVPILTALLRLSREVGVLSKEVEVLTKQVDVLSKQVDELRKEVGMLSDKDEGARGKAGRAG